jgi:uncharacterized protein
MFEFDQDIVQNLLKDNVDFKRMFDKHGMLELKLEESYNKTDNVDDITLGTLKKEKLHLMDKMAAIVENSRLNQYA